MKKYETWPHLIPSFNDANLFAKQIVFEFQKNKPNYAKVKAWANDLAIAIDADD